MSNTKLEVNIDATSLGHSACILDFYRTVIGDLNDSGTSSGGYKERQCGPELTYGVAVHKFLDIAYKTNGNLHLARRHAHQAFNGIPTREPGRNKQHLHDSKHLDVVCTNVWTDFCLEDSSFQIINLVLPCWLCKGTGLEKKDQILVPCVVCNGQKQFIQPATEVTFSIRYYEDDYIIVNLCGTIDKIGRLNNGPYCIGDWKTSSSWDNEGYFQQYEMSRQLRMYALALRLMGSMHPDSILGKIGSRQVSAFIDAIFINKEPNDSKVIRSDLYPIKDRDLDAFQLTLDDKIRELSQAVKTGYIPKQGILNGSCIKWQQATEKNFVKCLFWNVCKVDENVGQVLLKRDFEQKTFNPLNYNEV